MAVADDERVTLDELEPVDTGDPDELEITIDEDDEERDRRDSARELDGIVVARALEAATRSAPTNMRLATLETWRLDIDRWRLRLTGVDDTNGKIGKLGETIAELRRDVGDRKECERVRAVGRHRRHRCRSGPSAAAALPHHRPTRPRRRPPPRCARRVVGPAPRALLGVGGRRRPGARPDQLTVRSRRR